MQQPKDDKVIPFVKSNSNSLLEASDLINLGILLFIALLIGIYLISTTALIAKDGIGYIKQAQKLQSHPGDVIKNSHSFGYICIISLVHKVAAFFANTPSIRLWIYSAQTATLLCRLLALLPLYLIGKIIMDSKRSFWAILILIILPYPAHFGSDTVRIWPYILFLATGFLFLLIGAKTNKWQAFGVAGFAAGLGYMVRPECAQLIIYGFLWLLTCLFKKKYELHRKKIILAFLALSAGFILPVALYSKASGRMVPDKLRPFLGFIQKSQQYTQTEDDTIATNQIFESTSLHRNPLKAIGKLFEETNDNLFYFFLPAFLIGIYCRLYKRSQVTKIEKFFITSFASFNVVMLIALYDKFGHISRRHCLPLVVLLIFYVPIGLQVFAEFFNSKFPKVQTYSKKTHRWFFVLLTIGIVICSFKLLRPIRSDKQGLRDAAEWLRKNTDEDVLLVVPDVRISLYAERKELVYSGIIFPSTDVYVISTEKVNDVSNKKHTKERKNKTNIHGKKTDSFSSKNEFSLFKGLIGYWPGDFNAKDHTFHKNHGTLHGQVSYTPGKYGQAFELSKTGKSYINCGNSASLNPTGSITVSVWIYPNSKTHGAIIAKNGPYTLEFLPDCTIRGGIHSREDKKPWTFSKSSTNLKLHKWHHIIMTYDNSHIRLYINGKIDGTDTPKTGDMTVITNDLYIGYGSAGIDYFFDGLIDEVMIFGRALPLEEIEGLYYEGPTTQKIPRFEAKTKQEKQFWLNSKKNCKLTIYKVSIDLTDGNLNH